MTYIKVRGELLEQTLMLSTADFLLQCFENNPFAAIREMKLNDDANFQPYNRNAAAILLSSNVESSLSLRSKSNLPLAVSVSFVPNWRNLIWLYFESDNPDDNLDGAIILDFAKTILAALPNSSSLKITDDLVINDFYREHDLDLLPDAIEYVCWYHFLKLNCYNQHFEKTDLRDVPAHKVSELHDGSFEIFSYPDLRDYASEDARQQIIKINNYLNQHRRD